MTFHDLTGLFALSIALGSGVGIMLAKLISFMCERRRMADEDAARRMARDLWPGGTDNWQQFLAPEWKGTREHFKRQR